MVIVYPTTEYQSDVNFLNWPFKIGKLSGRPASSTLINIRIIIRPMFINCERNIFVREDVSFSVMKWFLSYFDMKLKNSSYRMLIIEIAPAMAMEEIYSKR